MQSQDNRTVCDVCGSHQIVERFDEMNWCQSCIDKRRQWDEGARFSAIMQIGHSIRILRDYGAERWAILSAVDIALNGGGGFQYEEVGMHPDDAHALAAHIGEH